MVVAYQEMSEDFYSSEEVVKPGKPRKPGKFVFNAKNICFLCAMVLALQIGDSGVLWLSGRSRESDSVFSWSQVDLFAFAAALFLFSKSYLTNKKATGSSKNTGVDPLQTDDPWSMATTGPTSAASPEDKKQTAPVNWKKAVEPQRSILKKPASSPDSFTTVKKSMRAEAPSFMPAVEKAAKLRAAAPEFTPGQRVPTALASSGPAFVPRHHAENEKQLLESKLGSKELDVGEVVYRSDRWLKEICYEIPKENEKPVLETAKEVCAAATDEAVVYWSRSGQWSKGNVEAPEIKESKKQPQTQELKWKPKIDHEDSADLKKSDLVEALAGTAWVTHGIQQTHVIKANGDGLKCVTKTGKSAVKEYDLKIGGAAQNEISWGLKTNPSITLDASKITQGKLTWVNQKGNNWEWTRVEA